MGISIRLDDDDLVIKGSKMDLIELSEYIKNVALSNNKNDHLHLDELTLIKEDSPIKNLIIEKKQN